MDKLRCTPSFNVVNATDFNLLRAAFGTSNDNRTDFNNDDLTNAQDFNLLRGNFGIGGAGPVRPSGSGGSTDKNNDEAKASTAKAKAARPQTVSSTNQNTAMANRLNGPNRTNNTKNSNNPNNPSNPNNPNVTRTLTYLHGDHLGSISVASSSAGALVSQQEFDPWGKVRTGMQSSPVAQTKLNFTGQKLDDTGLLFYNARYYDPHIARFVSADSIVPGASRGTGGTSGSVGVEQNSRLTVDYHEISFVYSVNGENLRTLDKGFWFQFSDGDRQKARKPWGPSNPQAFNRYSYVLNNPLRYIDPTGHGTIHNHSDVPIIVVGDDNEVVVVPPGKSAKDMGIDDADFWRPIDGDPTKWMKIGPNDISVENHATKRGQVQYKRKCDFVVPWCSWSGPKEFGADKDDMVTCNSEQDCEGGQYSQMGGAKGDAGVLPGGKCAPNTWCKFRPKYEKAAYDYCVKAWGRAACTDLHR